MGALVFHRLQRSNRKRLRISFNAVPKMAQPGPKACGKCDETFHTERMLHMHERVIHEKLPCHLCPHCRAPFGRATDVNRHILEAHDPAKMPKKCDQCPCSFNTEVQLRQHVQTDHDRQAIKCEGCEFETVHHGVLKQHVEESHGLEWKDDDNPGAGVIGELVAPKE